MSFKKIMAAVLTAAMVFVNGCASTPAANSKDKDKDEKESHTGTTFFPVNSAGMVNSGGTTSNISGSSRSSVSSEGHSGIGSSAGRGGSFSAAS